MHWEKKICIRITIRRIVGAIVAASTVANLIIVGGVFGAESHTATPTTTSTLTLPLSTNTFLIPVSGTEEAPTLTEIPVITPTDILSPTPTDAPIWMVCIKRFYWPTYRVDYGDTLSKLASATDSTVNELISANCLENSQIYVGQVLYVPRLIISTITATATATQTASAMVTPSQTSTNTSTATYTPTATDTPSPTQTFTPTPTATPITPARACDHAEFVADVTVPPGTVMLPGTSFTKTWRFRNIGSCTWTRSYTIVYMDGEQFGASAVSQLPTNVPPGGTVDISLNMIAPRVAGSYGSSWMFRNANGALFGIGEQANLPWSMAIRVPEPTVFQNPSVCLGSNNNTNLYLAFAVTISNSQDVRSVTAFSDPSVVVPLQDIGGGVYSGAVIGSGGYSPGMVVPYYFVVQDRLGQSIRSADYSSSLIACGPVLK